VTPFASRAFRILCSSTVAAAAAQGMERTATAWLALEAGSGAFGIGVIFAARMLPSLLLGLIAGTIADRTDRPRQLMAVAGVTLFVMAAFGWIAGGGHIQVWQVVLFSFAAGCLNVFDMPARQALVLDTVPRAAAPRALALHALASRLAAAAGAILAGVLITRIGIAYCYYIIAVTYGIMGALVAMINVAHRYNTIVTPPPFRRAFREASRLIVDMPGVRTLFIAGLICEIFAFSFGSAVPIFAQNVLETNASGLGMLNAAVSIGGAIAVIILSMLHTDMPRQPLLGAIFLFYGLSLVLFSMTQSLFLAAAVLLLVGFCAAAFDVLQQTLIQLAVPDEQRGRAVGVWILGIGSAPIGHLEMGILASVLGVATALLINGSLTIISALILLIRAPSYRWKSWRHDAKQGHEHSEKI
jgi:predicted MFS family arabinose efflux permease